MIFNLLYIVLAAFGLGFLIFIHEYGHYWMARKEGMTVEAFSIGFGKPILRWEKDGVKWQLGWLPFGGFVRIAGMEKKGSLEPHQIADGFFGKRPLARIKVALMGPIVNIAFAFVAFCLLWIMGGRTEPFSKYTRLIGSVDPASNIYALGVRPGDEINTINQKPFQSFQDFLFAAVLDDKPPQIQGLEENYLKQTSTPFQYEFQFAKGSPIAERIQLLFNTLRPASYLIYHADVSLKNSPMKDSGIEDGDRILWVDGELIFSRDQLVETINEPKALITVQRGNQFLLTRVPRVNMADLRLKETERLELEDWQHEAGVNVKSSELFFIPYGISPDCRVEKVLSYFNGESVEEQPQKDLRSPLQNPLNVGDKIVAVDGIAVESVYSLVNLLQTRHIQIIVKKQQSSSILSWKEADKAFIADIDWKGLNAMIHSIGTNNVMQYEGNLKLLKPVAPKPLNQLSISEEKRAEIQQHAETELKAINEIKDPEVRAQALQLFQQEQNRLKLGIAMLDRPVTYNPSPFVLFNNVFKETWKTLVALFSGTITPKYMTGPVGIVQVMQKSWGSGFKQALFWLGMISMNLGILNLLPIPVLDGGHVCFSLWEWATGKPIPSKTMQRLIIPFVVLLVTLFVYLTYNDITRIVTGFFH